MKNFPLIESNWQKYLFYLLNNYKLLIQNEEFIKAEKIFLEVKNLNERESYVDILNGIKSSKLKRYEDAIEYFNKAIQTNPNKYAYFFKGKFLEESLKIDRDFKGENHILCFIEAHKMDYSFFPAWAQIIKFLYKEKPRDLTLFQKYGKILETKDKNLAKEFYFNALSDSNLHVDAKSKLYNLIKAEKINQSYSLLALCGIKLLTIDENLDQNLSAQDFNDKFSLSYLAVKQALNESKQVYSKKFSVIQSSSNWQEYVTNRKNHSYNMKTAQ